jgi:hypothetical protein
MKRSSGSQRQVLSSSVTASNTDAVVVPEYCGYSGSTSSRRTLASFSRIQRLGHRRVAVAHAELDPHALAEALRPALLQARRPGAGDVEQRRAALGPDRLVGAGRAARAHAQDDAVQDQPPDRPRHLDHARVVQELRQVAAHGGRRRGIGGAEVQHQHAEALRRAVLEAGHVLVSHDESGQRLGQTMDDFHAIRFTGLLPCVAGRKTNPVCLDTPAGRHPPSSLCN